MGKVIPRGSIPEDSHTTMSALGVGEIQVKFKCMAATHSYAYGNKIYLLQIYDPETFNISLSMMCEMFEGYFQFGVTEFWLYTTN